MTTTPASMDHRQSNHAQSNHAQFDPQAQAYLHSAVHAQGPDLAAAHALAARHLPAATARVLDVGCGAGHLSFALAPAVNEVVALDPSPSMLATVAQAAAERGLPQVRTVQAGAEALPFGDGHFCMTATRYSAHHWTRLDAALREMHRVTKPGGYLMVIDVLGDDDALVDTHLQAMELLRDPSHARDRSAVEWRSLIAEAGYELIEHTHWPLRLEFASWVARMRTPAASVAMIRALQRGAPQEVHDALAIEPDGSFSARTGLFFARKRR
ncbi:class I SAM-dependent methyltransferase [Sphaerotilaceae bacterium SBD11-9]